MTDRWEYKVIYIGTQRWTTTGLPGDVNEQFDRIGDLGWELVATESLVRPSWFGSSTTTGIVAIFKRPYP